MWETADNALVVFDVPDYGEWSVSAFRDDIPSDTVAVTVDTAKQYDIELIFFVSTITVTVEPGSTVVCEDGGRTQTKISDGSSTIKLSRTDNAGLFADPAPAVGTGAGFSPFDDCYPWNGMTKVTDGNNVLVKIPKYWVKV